MAQLNLKHRVQQYDRILTFFHQTLSRSSRVKEANIFHDLLENYVQNFLEKRILNKVYFNFTPCLSRFGNIVKGLKTTLVHYFSKLRVRFIEPFY